MHAPTFSIVILTFNRPTYLRRQIDALYSVASCEIIVVDNHSDTDYVEDIAKDYPNIKTVHCEKNYGAVGRNFGMEIALGEIVVTLDDDIYGLTESDLHRLKNIFAKDNRVNAICFKVKDEASMKICNWCHPRDPALYAESSFETYNISEGAVAFKRSLFNEIDLYPLDFFISHEGIDLGYRIINAGYSTVYSPEIEVIHAYAPEGRKSWRRYYYDTRNIIWLAYRNYTLVMMIKKLPIQLIAMFIYSLRDGFLRYYWRGIWHGIKTLPSMKNQRNPLNKDAYQRVKLIDSDKPSISYYIKRRLLKKGVKI